MGGKRYPELWGVESSEVAGQVEVESPLLNMGTAFETGKLECVRG